MKLRLRSPLRAMVVACGYVAAGFAVIVLGLLLPFWPWVPIGGGLTALGARVLWPRVVVQGDRVAVWNVWRHEIELSSLASIAVEQLPGSGLFDRYVVVLDTHDLRSRRCWALTSNGWPIAGPLLFRTKRELDEIAEHLRVRCRVEGQVVHRGA